MKLAVIAAMLGAVSSCSTTDIATVEAQAQQAAMLACAFLPTIDTVAAIIATNNPAVATGAQIGSAICAAVQNSGVSPAVPTALLSPTSSAPTVFGIPIHGRFIGTP